MLFLLTSLVMASTANAQLHLTNNYQLFQKISFEASDDQTVETVQAALTLSSRINRPFVLVPLNGDLAALTGSQAVVLADEESWKSLNYHYGAAIGLPNVLSIRFGVNLLKDTLTAEGELSPAVKVWGGGMNVNVTPLAALGFKYVYINTKIYAVKIFSSSAGNRRSNAWMKGIGLGVRIPGTKLTIEVGPTRYNFTREDSTKESVNGWYGAIGISTPFTKKVSTSFKRLKNKE